jgi:parallel beta-helix repeat protein
VIHIDSPWDAVRLVLLSVVAIVSLSGIGIVASQPPGPQGPTAGPQGPTAVDSCTTIARPGTYVLQTDIEDARRDCITIRTDDVVLDGDGHTVDGEGRGAGILVGAGPTVENVTITRVTATDWETGIGLIGSSRSALTDSFARGNDVGVLLASNRRGNRPATSTANHVENTTATTNRVGILLRKTSETEILETVTRENEQVGVELHSAQENTLEGITARGNGQSGLRLMDATGTQIATSTVTANPVGFQLEQSGDTLVRNTTADANTQWAFRSVEDTAPNSAERLTLEQTTVSFQSRDVALQSVTSPPDDPDGLVNAGKYVSATDTSAAASLLLTVHYTDADIAAINESTLRLWRHADATWSQVAGQNDFGTDANTVTAKITSFNDTDIFAPLGEPETAPGPIGRPIDACTVITEPGDYVLTQDIGNATETPCIDVRASDVHFDGQGHLIDGVDAPSAIGIGAVTTQLSNVTVENVRVTDWHYGVRLQQLTTSQIRNLTALSNYRGINVEYGNQVRLTESTATDNQNRGVTIVGGEDIVVRDNAATENHLGVELDGDAHSILFEANTISNNDFGMIAYPATESSNTTVLDNVVTHNTEEGIIVGRDAILSRNTISHNQLGVKTSDGVIVTNNTISNSASHGVDLGFSNNVSIQQNTITSNADTGILAFVGEHHNLLDNEVSDNRFGIKLRRDTTNTLVDGNTVTSNEVVGVVVEDAPENRVANNEIFSNGGQGVSVHYASGGTVLANNEVDSNLQFICRELGWGGNAYRHGITLLETSNVEVYGNTVTNNYRSAGIGLFRSSDNLVRNNYVGDHIVEIYLAGGGSNSIVDNSATDGLIFLQEWWDRPSNTINGNEGFTVTYADRDDPYPDPLSNRCPSE